MIGASEADQHVLNRIRYWVWSGYHDAAAVSILLENVLEDGVDASAMRTAIAAEFRRKAAAEQSWPAQTDCDRLDRAFIALDAQGVCAVQYAGYTMSEGYAEVAQALEDRGAGKYHGFCFFHGQDVARAIDGHGLMIAFGAVDGTSADKTIAVGKSVNAALNTAGFTTSWDGAADTRINIPAIDWKRRY